MCITFKFKAIRRPDDGQSLHNKNKDGSENCRDWTSFDFDLWLSTE